jgi:hypothetical protein
MNEEKKIRVTDLISIVTIVILGFFLLKGCNEVEYYKGLNDQNTKALTDTVEYYKGSYTKAIYIANNERMAGKIAEKDEEIQILLEKIKKLKAKPGTVIYIEPKYNNSVVVSSNLQQVNDSTYQLTFADTNLVRSIKGNASIFLKKQTTEQIVGNELNLTNKFSLYLEEDSGVVVEDKLNFGLGISLVESKEGYQEVVVTPLSRVGDQMVEIPKELLDIPIIKGLRIEKPQEVIEPDWLVSFGFSAAVGINPFNLRPDFVIGPSISIGKRINLNFNKK